MWLVAFSVFSLLMLLGSNAARASVIPQATSQSDGTAKVVLFHSPTCPHCHEVINEILPPLRAEYKDRLELNLIDVTLPENYTLFFKFQERHPGMYHAIPEIAIGDAVLVGTQAIEAQLRAEIDKCLANGGCEWPVGGTKTSLQQNPFTQPLILPTASADCGPTVTEGTAQPGDIGACQIPAAVSDPANAATPIYLAYFFDPTCIECERVGYDLNYLESQHPNLTVRRFDIRQQAALNEALSERYRVPVESRLRAPAIFAGTQFLVGEEISAPRLKALVESADVIGKPPPWEGLEAAIVEAESHIVERFTGFSALTVAGAGLLDGVNPCAFTTIIFFVSYLAVVGRKGREILMVGAAFTVGVFLTYLALGLGLSELVRQIGPVSIIGRVIYGITALICIGLALLSLWDYVKIRQGRLTEIALQLPGALKQRIHQTVRTRTRMDGFVSAAFGAGVLVSIFELVCTGQVYLPTIVFVTGVAEMRLQAIAYLLLYNLMFVVPLVVVFVVTYLGTSSRQLTSVFQSNAARVKLLTAVLFAVLGGWLAYMVLN
jgi:hypothetical protein